MNPSPQITSEVISASAGSGKTFQLTNRYISLVSKGIAPERIIALTFTKKAAGEIFDKIINKLWNWHEQYNDPKIRRQIQEAGLNNISKAELLKLLRKIVFSQNKIRISTIDSFFVNILQNFPMEFGIDGSFEIADDYFNAQNKETVLKQILSTNNSKQEKRTFLELFKKACYGKEIKTVRSILNEFVENYLYYYMLFKEENIWLIPGYSSNMLNRSVPQHISEISKLLNEKIDCFTRVTPNKSGLLTANQKQKLIRFLNEAGAFIPDSEFSKEADEIFTEILKGGYFFYNKNFKQCPSLRTLIEYLLKCFFIKYSQRTSGIFSILKEYDVIYDNLIRKNGTLSFTDVTYILNGKNNRNHPVLSCIANDSSDFKLYVDLKLDSHFDHWLIDEFQDTSRLQWNIIENLIDEVMNNPMEKSFFYVGDIKQAIYGWRGGDSHLFDIIRKKYEDRLNQRELNYSRRSSYEIVETVKNVFTKLINHQIPAIPPETIEHWKTGWGTEEYNTMIEERGYSTLIELTEKDKESPEKILSEIIKKIKEIDPIRRGLSVGILVYKNDRGRKFASELKKENIPVSLEGNFTLTDSSAVTLLLSLIKFAQHPADIISYNHLIMSPFNEQIKEKLTNHTEDFILELLNDISISGFSGLIKKWGFYLAKDISLNIFDSARLTEMIFAAKAFDISGNKNCMDFINYIESYKIPAEGNKKAVQVMTVYKAKGLEFDIVFLPDLKESIGNMIEKQLHGGLNTINDLQDGFPEFCSLLPKRDISTADPNIKKYIDKIDAEHCYEKFCCLYVAMTRAKRALYMYIPEQTDTTYSSTVLRDALTCSEQNDEISKHYLFNVLYEKGNEKWYQKYSIKEENKKAPISPAPALMDTKLKTIKEYEKETPSKNHDDAINEFINIKELFQKSNEEDVTEIGICIHYMFEQIDYLDIGKTILFGDSDKIRFNETVWEKAYLAFSKAAVNANIIKALTTPKNYDYILWKEKAFSLLINNKWITGQFDRVEILRNKQGNIVSATIFDFKFENITTSESDIKRTYENQMKLYKEVLSRLLAISEEIIFTKLILLNRLAILDA